MDNMWILREGLDLPRQYVVTDASVAPIPGWHSVEFGGMRFHLSPTTPHRFVTVPGAEATHLVIGWPFGVDENSGDPFAAAFGRYVLFTFAQGTLTCETDAFGNYPLVFSTQHRIAGSSPAALNRIIPLTPHRELLQSFADQSRAMWFPFGLTPFTGVARLMPHHRLDLTQWHCERSVLPSDIAQMTSVDAAEDAARQIALSVQSNIEQLARLGSYQLLLSGGYDSRMVLAACHSTLDQLECSTIKTPGGEIDLELAAHLSRRHGLTHSAIDLIPMTQDARDAWLERVGYCVRDAVTGLAATAEHYLSDKISLTGTGSDLVKAKHIRKHDLDADTSLTPADLVARYNLPPNPAILDAAEQWLAGLAGHALPKVLDFMHIEVRFGCWAAASAVGHRINIPSFSPFNARNIHDLVLALPHEYRMNGSFNAQYFATLWPELLETPFNRAMGWRRLRHLKTEVKNLIPRETKDTLKKYLPKR